MKPTNDLTQFDRFIYDELTPARNERGKYLCPICGSGTRANGTAALSIKQHEDGRTRFKCFSCNASGDIFDLFMQRDAMSREDATRAVIAKYGRPDAAPRAYTQTVSVNKQPPSSPDEAHRAKIRKHVADCHAAIMGSEGHVYLKSRGISDQSIQRFRLGYDANARRITIPGDKAGNCYTGRTLLPADAAKAQNVRKYDNPKGMTFPLYNADALYQGEPCFVVESALCAISIEQEGGRAVALMGTAGQQRLMSQIKTQTPTAPVLIVSMDNAPDGQEAANKLLGALANAGIPSLQANISGNFKDPNELLAADPAALRANIAAVVDQQREAAEAEERLKQQLEEQARAEYLASNTASQIQAFVDAVDKSRDTPAIPTGFPDLDRRLDGGLYEGLYLLGAVSSLGKTTFVHQMADQIARSGHDVLYFSLEMGRFELMAKSVSRLTYTLSRAKNGTASLAKTTRGILAGKKWEKYNAEELDLIQEAVSVYGKDYASRLWISEGVGNIGVYQIRAEVEKHIKYTGRTPVIIIDYVQILAPCDPHASDKQNTDKAVLELKRLSRDCKVAIVGISSLNRDNYSAPISMAAFKESGSLEYGSDVLIGLQHKGMDYEEGENDKARDKRIRELRKSNDEAAARGEPVNVELKILKARNGVKGDPIPYLFTPRYNHFAEATAEFTPAGNIKTPFDKPSKSKKHSDVL